VKALYVSLHSGQSVAVSSPKKTNNTVVQVRVAEVVGWDPDITSVCYELTHESCPLTKSSVLIHCNQYSKEDRAGTHASKALPFSLLSSSALTFSSGDFSVFSFLAAAWVSANLLPSARSLTREAEDDPMERMIPINQHRIEIRWIAASRLVVSILL
jgi:hypothetical protein